MRRRQTNPGLYLRCAWLWAVAPVVLLTNGAVGAENLLVFAAASLTESLKEIGAEYERQSGDRVTFNLAGSGPLRRQIEEGAPADVFFSADTATMDALIGQGLIVAESRRDRLSNQLVVVVPNEGGSTFTKPADLTSTALKRLALGDPRTVPAGAYAKEFLVKLGLWKELEARVVPCESVRAVLAAVESGNVEAGFVYRTDAGVSRATRVAFEVPPNEGPRITYPVAVLRESKHREAAGRFVEFLGGADAAKVFARRGFTVLEALPAAARSAPSAVK